jgi:hypothetical protein
MNAPDSELSHFFAWARSRVYSQLDARLKQDPSLDPNWTFSEIMQELLAEYHRISASDDKKGHDNVDSKV